MSHHTRAAKDAKTRFAQIIAQAFARAVSEPVSLEDYIAGLEAWKVEIQEFIEAAREDIKMRELFKVQEKASSGEEADRG